MMMKMNKVDILAFGAHPDDVEISAGGTIAKHIALGQKIAFVDLTRGELGTRGTAETRDQEARDAAQILGISARINLDLGDGFFEHNRENLIKIIETIRYFQPDLVLANAITDRHPDHAKGAKLVAEACFLSGLTKIKTDWEGIPQHAWRPKNLFHYIQDRYIKPDFAIDVTDYIETKFKALKCYKTQFYDPNSSEPQTPISGPSFFTFLDSRMRDVGREMQVDFAEGFTASRLIGIENFINIV
jgi:bacillithiol biosynthesis deacetylase BshB1